MLYLYIRQEQDHKAELKRIESIEQKHDLELKELEAIRSKTKSCIIDGLHDPRSCYLKSNYQCAWNEQADRCDAKDQKEN